MEKKTEVYLIKENDDGSADYMFNLPPESVAAFARLGIMTAIQAAVGEAEQLNPDYIEKVVRECADIAYEVGLHRQTKHEILRRFGLEVTDED